MSVVPVWGGKRILKSDLRRKISFQFPVSAGVCSNQRDCSSHKNQGEGKEGCWCWCCAESLPNHHLPPTGLLNHLSLPLPSVRGVGRGS